MMLAHYSGAGQRGVALTMAMLFLLIVTIVSVIAASNSSVGLKMSANMQDSYESFHAAEAGLAAVMSLAGTTREPFDGDHSPAPFAAIVLDEHPLRHLQDGIVSVDVDVCIVAAATSCPPRPLGSSVDLFNCEYYSVRSTHDVELKAYTRVEMGVVKTVIGGAGALTVADPVPDC